MKLSFLMLGFVSLLEALPAHADSVYVTAWQQTFNSASQTFWTFGPGLKSPAPVDPSAQGFAFYDYQSPFTVEDYAIGNLNAYYATYGTFGDPAATNTFAGYATLTDKDGFVAGLPFECTGSCSNVIYIPDNGVAEFGWLNSSLRRYRDDANARAFIAGSIGRGNRRYCVDVRLWTPKAERNVPQRVLTTSKRCSRRSLKVTRSQRHCLVNSFVHSQVGDSPFYDLFHIAPKPECSTEGSSLECPHCKTVSVYLRHQLTYSAQ